MTGSKPLSQISHSNLSNATSYEPNVFLDNAHLASASNPTQHKSRYSPSRLKRFSKQEVTDITQTFLSKLTGLKGCPQFNFHTFPPAPMLIGLTFLSTISTRTLTHQTTFTAIKPQQLNAVRPGHGKDLPIRTSVPARLNSNSVSTTS